MALTTPSILTRLKATALTSKGCWYPEKMVLFLQVLTKENVMNTKANFDDPAIIDTLQYIVDRLRSANYRNDQNELIDDPAFLCLEQFAIVGQEIKDDLSDADFIDESPLTEEPFHVE